MRLTIEVERALSRNIRNDAIGSISR
jgi:hypothetical protein